MNPVLLCWLIAAAVLLFALYAGWRLLLAIVACLEAQDELSDDRDFSEPVPPPKDKTKNERQSMNKILTLGLMAACLASSAVNLWQARAYRDRCEDLRCLDANLTSVRAVLKLERQHVAKLTAQLEARP